MADEMDFDVRTGEGTFLTARKFVAPVPRSEVAIMGRACEGQRRSGDDGGFVRSGQVDLFCLIDGLGHGPAAREASARATECLQGNAGLNPRALLDCCDKKLEGTRGAVMAATRIDHAAGTIVHAGVGNVSAHLYQDRAVHRFASAARVLGARLRIGKVVEEREVFRRRQLFVMFTDGLSSRLDLSNDQELRREPPLVIAHQLLVRYGRSDDDCLVLVATLGGQAASER